MSASLNQIEPERIVHVQFRGPRRVEVLQPTRPAVDGERALRAVPPARGRGSGLPDPSTLAAVALLIARNATGASIDRDLDAICQLLRQKCAWSEESLLSLRRSAATALEHLDRSLSDEDRSRDRCDIAP